ncbi:MAG: gliding motility-associated C-terminal domain-containing protein [Bacteroidetes bacterium]|nr:gliding motility-associated C-terminal domain-containing protein [Bacteroidota bacterium]
MVNDAPNALVSVEDSLVCSGASIQLYSEGGVSYLWSGPNNYSSTLQNPSISSFSSLNSGLYTVVVSSSDGCTGSSNLNLTIDQTTCFFIPSVFTPNNDGINDQWVIDGIWQFPNCVVRVLNRWGQELFQSNGYANPWDGKFDGENCPIADYYYIIDLQNGTKVYTGTVTIKY